MSRQPKNQFFDRCVFFQNFQTFYGIVTTVAWMVSADSAAESDPGNTYYVNAGYARPGYFAGIPAEVNEYGYKHAYGLVPKKKVYGYRLKPEIPVAVALEQAVPLTPVGFEEAVPLAPLNLEQPGPVSPVPVAHPELVAVTPTSYVHQSFGGSLAVTPGPLAHQPIEVSLAHQPAAVTPVPLAHTASSITPGPLFHRPLAVTPSPLIHSTGSPTPISHTAFPSPQPFSPTPFIGPQASPFAHRAPPVTQSILFTPAPNVAPEVPALQPVAEVVHQETVQVGEIVHEVQQPIRGGIRFPSRPTPAPGFNVPAAVPVTPQPVFNASPLPVAVPEQPQLPAVQVQPQAVPQPVSVTPLPAFSVSALPVAVPEQPQLAVVPDPVPVPPAASEIPADLGGFPGGLQPEPVTILEPVPGFQNEPGQFLAFDPAFESQRLPVLEAVPTQHSIDPLLAAGPASASPLLAQEPPPALGGIQTLQQVDPDLDIRLEDPDSLPSPPVIVSTPKHPLQAFPAVPV